MPVVNVVDPGVDAVDDATWCQVAMAKSQCQPSVEALNEKSRS